MDSNSLQYLFGTDDFNNDNINLDKIKQKCKNNHDLKEIMFLKQIHENLLVEGCQLNKNELDNKGNKENGWSVGEKRGGFKYIPPPEGWKGFGLNVLNKYDNGNNDWLAKNGNKNEWAIAYHGIGIKMGSGFTLEKVTKAILKEGFKPGHGQAYAEDDDSRHPGKKVGKGVYCTPNPAEMEYYANDAETTTSVNDRKFMMAFMIRVNPDKIRFSKYREDYWVLNGSKDEMRPYRILIKDKDYNRIKEMETNNDVISKPKIIGKNSDWVSWIENMLINKQDIFGHVYQNVLTEAAIINIYGEEMARTDGLLLQKNEVQELKKLFEFDNNSYTILYVNLAGKKYRVIHYVKNFSAYLKINEGGATVAKTQNLFIIGVYNNTQKYIYDGQIKRQCIGMCNTVVEDAAIDLKKKYY